MGLKYSVNEFISLIADGTLHHSDIIDYAGEVDDVKELLYSLLLSNIACVESTGKPLITTCREERRIDYASSIISKKFNVSVYDDDNELDLPDGLDSTIAKRIFIKAIDLKLMTKEGDYYKWNKSKALLAYMLDKIYPTSFPEKALNKFFNEDRLGKARSQNYNSKGGGDRPPGKPKEYKIVDDLFKEA